MSKIDIDKLVAEIEKRLHANGAFNEVGDEAWTEDVGMCNAYKSILSFLDTLETKEVDLEESARHYLLHEHTSSLNEVLHQADLKVELQYHKDIENAFKAGFELGLKQKGG